MVAESEFSHLSLKRFKSIMAPISIINHIADSCTSAVRAIY